MRSTSTRTLTTRFVGFWPRFDPHEFFVPLLGHVSGRAVDVVGRRDVDVDVEVWSVFDAGGAPAGRIARLLGRRRRAGGASIRIWYTGENRRPPGDGFDGTLSFDTDDHGGTNAYLPLPYLQLTWPSLTQAVGLGEAARLGARPSPDDLATPRPAPAERPKFACAFFGNPEPTRMRFVEVLREVGEVDVFGAAVGRPVGPKLQVAAAYRYMICFENTVHPGYVTEKPIEAWWSGCVPIWNGIDSRSMLNPAALLNRQDHRSLADLAAAVADVDRTAGRWAAMQREPIASHAWSLAEVEAFLAARLGPLGR